MRNTVRIVVAALALVGLVAGCGGDDEAAETTTTTESDSGETTTESDSGETTTTEPTAGGAADFTSEECRQLAEAFDNAELGAALQSGEDPTEELEAAAELLQEAADRAPDEVRGDIETLAETYGELAETSAGVDWDGIRSGDPAAVAGATQFAQAFGSDAEFVTAAQNLSTWAMENCAPTG